MHEIEYVTLASRFARNSNRNRAAAHNWATLQPPDRKAEDRHLHLADPTAVVRRARCRVAREAARGVCAVRSHAGSLLRSGANSCHGILND
jgi:hypothetical protein